MSTTEKLRQLQMTIVIVGAGNVGLFLTQLVARQPDVKVLVVIDREAFQFENLEGQDAFPKDVRCAKATIAARRAQRIGGSRLKSHGIVADLADVPWGIFADADVILGALDSRQARVDLARICWRLGKLLIDTGVNADERLARVSVYLPSSDGPCFMCGIQDWGRQEAKYTCNGAIATAPPTGAPAYLGAIAASLAADKLCRLTRDRSGAAMESGREVVVSLNEPRTIVTHERRNPQCPFDHEVWEIRAGPNSDDALGDAFSLEGVDPKRALRVEGKAFVRRLCCPGCGYRSRSMIRLQGRLNHIRQCPRCRAPMAPFAFDMSEQLVHSQLTTAELRTPLNRLGFQEGDVLSVSGPESHHHYRIGGSNEE
jgi:molybdopterin/thiamine biosynthesis adenylyltransferase